MDVIATLFFLVFYVVSRLLTRMDGQILAVYRRHVQYYKYYLAQPLIQSPVLAIRNSVPVYQGQKGFL